MSLTLSMLDKIFNRRHFEISLCVCVCVCVCVLVGGGKEGVGDRL